MMLMLRFSVVVALIWSCLAWDYEQPQQVHLSFGADPTTQIVVTWVTASPTGESVVEYGNSLAPPYFDSSKNGTEFVFEDGGEERRQMYIHRVLLDNLIPGGTYVYHCGSNWGWSTLYSFRTMKNGTNWSPRLAVYGDMGNENAQSLGRLQEEVQRGNFDAILHVGDFAYNMDDDNARVGDQFMRQIEPIAAMLPYQTCVGNHEQKYNFSNYVNRFSMVDKRSQQVNNLFYSFDIGPAHFIAFSTEFYYYVEYGWSQIWTQYEWLKNDLQEAAKNRAERPWIITMGHRPMYCESKDRDDCTNFSSIVRTGIPIVHAYGLEDLFYEYGVDLELWAHEHVYERMWPVYNRTVYNGSYEFPYTNPPAPVHIITGSAGCDEGLDPAMKDRAEWSAVWARDYGYSRLTIYNETHLHLEQVSDNQSGKVIDEMMLIKEHHGPYPIRLN